MLIKFYNRKIFIIIASVIMSINNGLGAIFLPYFSKHKLLVTSKELGGYAFISAAIYIITALNVSKIERYLKLQKSLLIFLCVQLLSFLSIFFVNTKIELLIPFMLVGMAQGGWWPLIEGGMCEEQNQFQKKRAVAFFNVSWLSGLIIGPFMAGAMYGINEMWPLWGGLIIIVFVMLLVLIPQSLHISPWKCIPSKTTTLPDSLKHYIVLGTVLNFLSYLYISSYRSLLVEFTSLFNINSFQYGIIQASFNFGILSFMIVLMRSNGWQFSLKVLLTAIFAYISLLLVYSRGTQFPYFIGISFLLGAPCALVYFSSLYYGMLGEKSGSDHGGHHEAMIGLGQSIGPLISGLLISTFDEPRYLFYWPATLWIGVGLILFTKMKKGLGFS